MVRFFVEAVEVADYVQQVHLRLSGICTRSIRPFYRLSLHSRPHPRRPRVSARVELDFLAALADEAMRVVLGGDPGGNCPLIAFAIRTHWKRSDRRYPARNT